MGVTERTCPGCGRVYYDVSQFEASRSRCPTCSYVSHAKSSRSPLAELAANVVFINEDDHDRFRAKALELAAVVLWHELRGVTVEAR